MKRIAKKLFVAMALILAFSSFPLKDVQAQCAMCSLTAESSVKNGNTQGEKLNKGILVLLSAPYLAVGLVGFMWYKKYRKKQDSQDSESVF